MRKNREPVCRFAILKRRQPVVWNTAMLARSGENRNESMEKSCAIIRAVCNNCASGCGTFLGSVTLVGLN